MKMFFAMSFTLLLAVEFVTTATLAGPNTAIPSNETKTAVVSNDANNPDTKNSDDPTLDANNPDDASKVDMNISVPSDEDDGTNNHLGDNMGKLDHAQNGDVSNVMPSSKGIMNVDRNLKQDDQLTQLVSLFLRTKNLDSMRGQLYCNTNSGTMADCTIYVRAGEGTISITQNTIMERVLIICMGTHDNCMSVAAGVSLHIHTAVISGNKKGRFIEMGASSEVILRDVEGYEFGRATGLSGGFIYCGRGAENYKLEISNSTIRNNQGSYGGALHLRGAGELTIYNTIFEANTVTDYGGAIYGSGSRNNTVWKIQKSTFKKNTAASSWTNRGGAISTYYTTATITDTHFTGNTAKEGGAVWMYDSIFTFQCSSFTSNSVSTANNAGAIYAYYSEQITLIKTMFLDNKANNAVNDINCRTTNTIITRDLYTTELKNTGTCNYHSIPPFSKDNVDCIPSA